VFFVVGGVGVVAGAVLWLTAPSGKPSEKSAMRRLLVEGTF
jgi:hypothetical protein